MSGGKTILKKMRVSEGEDKAITDALEKTGENFSQFARRLCLAEANRLAQPEE